MPLDPFVTFLGHSTVVVEMDGVRLITDPILRNRVTFLRRIGPAVQSQMYQNISVVLISHLHYDHLDVPSLRMLQGQFHFIVPRGAGAVLRKVGFLNYQELQEGESAQVGPLSVQAVFADHLRQRYPSGPSADCLGYLIKGSAKIYFPGDTRLFPGMADLAGGLDLALLPVWGWGPDRGTMHMGPKEAAEALNLLHPRLAVPIHWGTLSPFWLSWFNLGFHYLPPIEFASQAGKIAPDVKVRILSPGETLKIEKETGF